MTSRTLACSGRRGSVTAKTVTVFDAEIANSITSAVQDTPMATTSHYHDITSRDPPPSRGGSGNSGGTWSCRLVGELQPASMLIQEVLTIWMTSVDNPGVDMELRPVRCQPGRVPTSGVTRAQSRLRGLGAVAWSGRTHG